MFHHHSCFTVTCPPINKKKPIVPLIKGHVTSAVVVTVWHFNSSNSWIPTGRRGLMETSLQLARWLMTQHHILVFWRHFCSHCMCCCCFPTASGQREEIEFGCKNQDEEVLSFFFLFFFSWSCVTDLEIKAVCEMCCWQLRSVWEQMVSKVSKETKKVSHSFRSICKGQMYLGLNIYSFFFLQIKFCRWMAASL